jgi:hypothetical protein
MFRHPVTDHPGCYKWVYSKTFSLGLTAHASLALVASQQFSSSFWIYQKDYVSFISVIKIEE